MQSRAGVSSRRVRPRHLRTTILGTEHTPADIPRYVPLRSIRFVAGELFGACPLSIEEFPLQASVFLGLRCFLYYCLWDLEASCTLVDIGFYPFYPLVFVF